MEAGEVESAGLILPSGGDCADWAMFSIRGCGNVLEKELWRGLRCAKLGGWDDGFMMYEALVVRPSPFPTSGLDSATRRTCQPFSRLACVEAVLLELVLSHRFTNMLYCHAIHSGFPTAPDMTHGDLGKKGLRHNHASSRGNSVRSAQEWALRGEEGK